MSKVFFKIVVPNYNNMPYIKKCLDSILEQTFQDFCIVVVDDCSTDMSDKFCEMYAEKLPDKVKFLRLPKKGYAGAARNLALAYNEIEAQYIWFIDSDDWLYDKDVLKRMCSKIVESGYPDLLRCGAAFMYSKSRIVGMRAYRTLDEVASKGRCAPWWSCMKAKFSSIQFLEGRAKCNDVMWFAKLLDAVNQKSVAEVASPCVVYNVMSTTSAWHSGKKASKDCQEAMEQCYYDMLAYKPATRAAALFKQYTLKFCKKPALVKKQAVAAKADASTKPAKQQKTSNGEVFFKIIIPNYNNMPYIKKCLDSILNQTFQDFKIIVVDDMSTDMSDKFCEMYARQHPDKIVYMQLKKKGYAGAARNAGLDYPIDCKYILFIDSDDWLYNNTVLNSLHQEIVSSKKDVKLIKMAMWHFYGENDSRNFIKKFDINLTLQQSFYNGCGPGRACISSSLSKCLFKENRRINNDVIWFLRCIDNINSKNLLSVQFPCQTYNRISSTSGTNIIKKYNTSKMYILQLKLLVLDLKHEKFKTDIVKTIQKKLIHVYSNELQNIEKNKNISLNNMTIDKFFKYSYVISIDQKKLKLFKKIFSYYFPNMPLPKFHQGSIDTNLTGPQNCTKSHYDIISYAKKHKFPFVMIFEDDAYPCRDALSKFENYITQIPSDTKLLILGWSDHKRQLNCTTSQSFQKTINKITNRINGSHAYIIFKSGYDDYLNFIDTNKNATADGDVFLYLQPSYILDTAMFIQYSNNRSMNGHIGYIYYGDHDIPPKNFDPIQIIDNTIVSKKSIKISVITPFYNTQNFVDTYFKTLSSQTIFNEIEILCIDDNSSDNTYSKILEYSKKFPNVRVFQNQENKGSGFSRNVGLDHATGEFIAFLDSDDFYPANDSLERLYNYSIRTKTNICGGKITPVKIVNGKYQQLKPFFEKDADYELNKIISFDDFQYIYYFTRYIYRRSFLNENNIRFKNYKRFQDPVFLYDAMTTAKVFYAIGYSTYCFTANDHWKNLSNEQEYDRLFAIKELLNTIPKKYNKLCNFLIQLVIGKIDNNIIEKSKDSKFNELLKTFVNVANEKKMILTKENLTNLQLISNKLGII